MYDGDYATGHHPSRPVQPSPSDGAPNDGMSGWLAELAAWEQLGGRRVRDTIGPTAGGGRMSHGMTWVGGRSPFLLLAVCLLAPAALSAQAATRTLTLTSLSFDGTGLPFDVPFRVATTVSREVTKFCISRRQKVLDENSTSTGKKDTPAEDSTFEWKSACWESLGGVGEAERVASVMLDALDVDQIYTFRFESYRRVPDEARDKLVAQANKKIEGILKGSLNQNIARTAVDDLWKEVRLAIRDVARGDTLVDKGSFFDPDLPAADYREPFRNSLIVIKNAWEQVLRRQGNALADASSAETQLFKVTQSVPLQVFVAKLAALSEKNPVFAAVVAAQTDAIALAKLNVEQVGRVVRGTADTGSDPSIGARETPAELKTRSDLVWATRRQVLALRALISGFVNDEGVNRHLLATLQAGEPTLSQADLAALRAMIDAEAIEVEVEDEEAIEVEVEEAEEEPETPEGSLPALSNHLESIATDFGVMRDQEQVLESGLTELAARIQVGIESVGVGDFSTGAAHQIRRGWYVSNDTGVLFAPALGEAAPYTGVNIYFRPVNKDAPLSSKGDFARRFSVLVGFTLTSLADSAVGREDYFGGKSLVIGAGLRITTSVRLNLGGVVFKGDDPSKAGKSTAISGFGSISFDIQLNSLPTKAKEFFGGGG